MSHCSQHDISTYRCMHVALPAAKRNLQATQLLASNCLDIAAMERTSLCVKPASPGSGVPQGLNTLQDDWEGPAHQHEKS